MEVGPEHGLPAASVISCDNLVTIPLSLFEDPAVGHLDLERRIALDSALRYAVDIQH